MVLGRLWSGSTLSVRCTCMVLQRTTHGIALRRQGHHDGQVNCLHCQNLVSEQHNRSAQKEGSPFLVLACPASTQSQLRRCEHHAPLSAYASESDHTVRLQYQTVSARWCCTAEWQRQHQHVAGRSKVAYADDEPVVPLGHNSRPRYSES